MAAELTTDRRGDLFLGSRDEITFDGAVAHVIEFERPRAGGVDSDVGILSRSRMIAWLARSR